MPLMRVSALNGISSTPDCVLSGEPATPAPTSTPAPIGTGSLEIPLPVRFTPRCSASETIDLPSVVSSASEDSSAASASSFSVWPLTGMNWFANRLPNVIVPVLSSSNTLMSPAASTDRPDMASTLKRVTRSMPAMPIAESSAPIVVGIRHTSRAMTVATSSGELRNCANGTSVTQTMRKMMVNTASSAVSRNDVVGLDHHDVALAQIGGCHHLDFAVRRQPLGGCFLLGFAEGRRLGASATLGDRLRVVGEDDRQDQDDGHQKVVAAGGCRPAEEGRTDGQNQGQYGTDFDHEHDWIAPHPARIQLDHRLPDGRDQDIGIKRLAAHAAGFGQIHRKDVSKQVRLGKGLAGPHGE